MGLVRMKERRKEKFDEGGGGTNGLYTPGEQRTRQQGN